MDLAEIGFIGIGKLRSAHADEMHLCEFGCFPDRRRESQAARVDRGSKQLMEVWLKERSLAPLHRSNLDRIGVDTDHVVAEGGHSRGVNRAEIARTYDRDSHERPLRNEATR